MTLNFDLDLWNVNSDICHRCWTSLPNFMKIESLLFEKSPQRASRTNERTNKHARSQYILTRMRARRFARSHAERTHVKNLPQNVHSPVCCVVYDPDMATNFFFLILAVKWCGSADWRWRIFRRKTPLIRKADWNVDLLGKLPTAARSPHICA